MKRLFKYGLLAAALLPHVGNAQELSQDIRQKIGSYLDNIAKKEIAVGRVKIDSVAIHGKNLQLFANMNWADFPFREDNVAEIYQGVSNIFNPFRLKHLFIQTLNYWCHFYEAGTGHSNIYFATNNKYLYYLLGSFLLIIFNELDCN